MRSRLSFVVISLLNAPSSLPLIVIPAVLAGWVTGVLFLPGPEDPLVRWLSLLAATGGLATLAGHFLDVVNLRRRYPLLVIAGGALCILLSADCLWREPSWGLIFRLSLPLILTGLLWFYTFYFSVFHGKQRFSRLQVGNRFPDFALPDSNGRTITLPDALAKGPTLLLFYKGDW